MSNAEIPLGYKLLNFHYLESWVATDVPCSHQCDKKGDHFTWNGDCPIGAIQAALEDRHRCVAPKIGLL